MDPEFDNIGKAFAAQYYQMKDSPEGRPQIVCLYTDTSMLTQEGTQLQGKTAIVEKILAMPIGKHAITTVDCQPSGPNGIIVAVIGQVQIEGERPMGFNQTFILGKCGEGWFIQNEIFRLALHNF